MHIWPEQVIKKPDTDDLDESSNTFGVYNSLSSSSYFDSHCKKKKIKKKNENTKTMSFKVYCSRRTVGPEWTVVTGPLTVGDSSIQQHVP